MSVLVARTGGVYIAPVGTVFPTAPTAPVGPLFKHVGKLNSPGITVTPSDNSNTSNFWENNEEFVISAGKTWTVGFEANDWNKETLSLYFAPEAFDTTEGSFIVGDGPNPVVALFIHFVSGSHNKAICVPRWEVTSNDAFSLISTDKLALPITGTARRDDELGGFFKVLDPELITAP